MNNSTRWFRIKFGYKVGEFISIPEEKLPKAIYAMQTGGIFSYGEKLMRGNEMKGITPDFHKHTGWNEWYEPKSAEDFEQIERDCPKYDGLIGLATDIAVKAMRENDLSLLEIKTLQLHEASTK